MTVRQLQIDKIKFSSIIFCLGLMCMCALQLAAQDDLNVEGGDDDEPLLLQPSIVDIGESYIGLSIGYTLPSGSFGRADKERESGFANNGLKISLDGAFIFGRNIGMGWSFGQTMNAINIDSYLEKIEYRLPNQVAFSADLNATDWRSNYLAIGPYISLPESTLMFEVGIYGGLVYAVSPEVVIFEGLMGENPLAGNISKDGTIAPMLMASIGINKHIGKNFRLFFKGEIMFARPEFREEYDLVSENFTFGSVDNYYQSIGFIGLNVGAAFELGDERKKDRKRKQYKQRFGKINKKIKIQQRKNRSTR